MKQPQSNPLQRELARNEAAAGLHPDADLLTAFAEGGLLEPERQEVLRHVALCAECREVLHLAAAAAPAEFPEAAPARERRRPLRAKLLWAGAGVALVIAATVGILHEQRLARERQSAVASNEPVNKGTQTPVEEMNAPVQSEKKKGSGRLGKPAQAAARLQGTTAAPRAVMRAPVMEKPLKLEPSAMPAQQNSDLRQSAQAGQSQGRSQQGSEGQGLAGAERQTLNALQSTQDSGAQYRSEQNQSRAPAMAGPVSAFGNVEPSRAMAKATIANLPRPHWRINAAGQAERSFGEGNWQRVLPDEAVKMRVISVFDHDVWIGGEESRLYLSPDNGSTWREIALPEKNGSDHAIAHISFAAPQTITVESADGTAWTSADGGATWK